MLGFSAISQSAISSIPVVAAGGGKLLTFNITQTQAYTQALQRSRVLAYNIAESQAYSSALNRNRTLAYNLAQAEAYALSLRRNRGINWSSNNTEAINFTTFNRARNVAYTLQQTEAVSLGDLLRNRGLDYDINQSEAISSNIAVLRGLVFLSTINETIAQDISRSQRLNTTLNQTETISSAVIRARALAYEFAESILYEFDVESAGQATFSFDVNQHITHSFGGMRRLRKLVKQIDQMVAYAVTTINRDRNVGFLTIEQQEILTNLLNVVKQIASTIDQQEVVNAVLSRRRDIDSTIDQITDLEFAINRLKYISYAVENNLDYNFLLTKLKEFSLSVQQQQQIEYMLNLTRGYTTSLDSTHSYDIVKFDRLRSQLITIEQTQGIDAAINRLIQVASTLSETLDISFSISLLGNPTRATITWQEWQTINGRRQLVDRVEEVRFGAYFSQPITLYANKNISVTKYTTAEVTVTNESNNSVVVVRSAPTLQ